MIKATCPSCGKTFNLKPETAGKKGKCTCGTSFVIPQPAPAPPPIEIVDDDDDVQEFSVDVVQYGASAAVVAEPELVAEAIETGVTDGNAIRCPRCNSDYDSGHGDPANLPLGMSLKVVCPSCQQWMRLPEYELIPPPDLPAETLQSMLAQARLLSRGNPLPAADPWAGTDPLAVPQAAADPFAIPPAEYVSPLPVNPYNTGYSQPTRQKTKRRRGRREIGGLDIATLIISAFGAFQGIIVVLLTCRALYLWIRFGFRIPFAEAMKVAPFQTSMMFIIPTLIFIGAILTATGCGLIISRIAKRDFGNVIGGPFITALVGASMFIAGYGYQLINMMISYARINSTVVAQAADFMVSSILTTMAFMVVPIAIVVNFFLYRNR